MTGRFPEDGDTPPTAGPEPEPDEDDLLETYPSLDLVRRFAAAIDRVSWFSRLGDPLDAEDREIADALLSALGFPDAEVGLVTDWEEAAEIYENPDLDTEGWEAEEQLRAGLMTDALARLGGDEELLGVTLAHVASRAAEPVETAALEAAAIGDAAEDEALVRAAAGAALQACHEAALVLAAQSEDDHPFSLKFRLFERGRWPLGLSGRSFNLF